MPQEDNVDPKENQDAIDGEADDQQPAPPAADVDQVDEAPAEAIVADEAPAEAVASADEAPADEESSDEDQPEEDTLPPFEFEAEDTGTLKKTVTVTVPRERIDAKCDEMFGELGQSAQVPGFRIGRAPRRLVEKRFGKEVSRDVCASLVGEALGYVGEHAEFRTIGEPDLKLDEIEIPDDGEFTFSFEVEVAPEFELPDVTGIPVEKIVLDINDERVDEYIDRIRQRQPKFEESSEGVAAERDIVIAETKVAVEGIDSPVEGKDVPLRVSAGQVEGLPLLELGTELAGKTAGDTVTLSVAVPESHPNEEWRGKQAAVDITITRLRRRILPELGDEYAENMGFESMDEFRQNIRQQMQQHVVTETQQAMRDQIGQYLVDNTDFELPPAMAARYSARTLQRRYVDLMYQGIPRDQIEEHMTELQAAAQTEAARDLKIQFIVGKIAKAEDIEADEGEINSRIADIAARNDRRPERVRHELEQDGSLDQVESQVIEEKVFDKLLDDAKITEISREVAEARRAAAQADTEAQQTQPEPPAEPDQDEPEPPAEPHQDESEPPAEPDQAEQD